VRAWIAAALLLAPLASCGGGGQECGNGVREGDEQCDDPNNPYCIECAVVLPPRTTVKWTFNAAAADQFSQDGCNDLHVSTVRIDLDGPTQATAEDMCPNHQVVFDDLPPGPYTATATPLDSNGDALVAPPVTQQVTAEATDSTDTIDIPWDAWIGPYTGDFFFTVRWGGLDCSLAGPPVSTQVLTMSVQGNVVTQQTRDGEPLDGSAPFACQPASNPMPMSALGLPFGPATILIVGRDATNTEVFRGQFDTFVGAGPSNPTINYDVPTVYDAGPPDADVPPDAGP
jgi:hypothetical protein